MANIKFSQFTTQTDPANVQFVVGFNGTTNVKIAPGDIGGGATDLNGLTDCLVIDNPTASAYIGKIPNNLIGNPVQNTTLGISSGSSITTGTSNTFIGHSTGSSTSTGSFNTLVGGNAASSQTGNNNTALGHQANFSSSSGNNSLYVGVRSGQSNTADGHVSIGYFAGYSNTTGAFNTNLGYQAGYSNTTNVGRTNLGYQAGFFSTGEYNTFLGLKVGLGSSGNTTGERNVGIGSLAIVNLTSGSRNVAIGMNSGESISTGSENVIIGDESGSTLTTGANNIVIGKDADVSSATVSNEITLGNASNNLLRIIGLGNTDGHVLQYSTSAGGIVLAAAAAGGATSLNGLSDCLVDTDSLYVGEVPAGLSGNPQSNTILGIDAGNALTTGTNNTFIGNDAGLNATTQNFNVAIGKWALRDGGGVLGEMVAIGYRAGEQCGGSSSGSNTIVGSQAASIGVSNMARSTHIGYKAGRFNGSNDTCTLGYFALYSNNCANAVAIGRSAATSASATGHISIGWQAGFSQTSGTGNTNLGYQAGYSNTTGASRVMLGYEAGYFNTGASNTFIGRGAGYGVSGSSTGSNTVAIGYEACNGLLTSGSNVAIGYQAMKDAQYSDDCVVIGNLAMTNVNSGDKNVAIGSRSMQNSSGNQNVCVGYDSGNSMTSGGNNTIIGYEAGLSVTNSSANTVLGHNALGYHNGNANVAIGGNAMKGSASFTGTGTDNVAIGYNAGGTGPTPYSNSILIGKDAVTSPLGQSNFIVLGNSSHTTLQIPGIQSGASDGDVLTFNQFAGKLELQAAGGGGASSLNGLTDCLVDTNSLYVGEVPAGLSGNPQGNTTLGIDAGNSLTTGTNNTILGSLAMDANTDGNDNVAIGYGALGAETSGDRNTAIGYEALKSQNQTFSAHNTAIGYQADDTTVAGFYRTALGAMTGRSGNGSNITNVGYSAIESSTYASNEVTLGNSSVAALRCAVTSITSLSDERDKTEIKDLGYGLAFIDALQPREFVWDNRAETNKDGEEFYSANKGKKDFGFIAQEVKELDNDTLRLVYDENPEKLELSYGKLVPVLVQAIKELKAEIELLKQ